MGWRRVALSAGSAACVVAAVVAGCTVKDGTIEEQVRSVPVGEPIESGGVSVVVEEARVAGSVSYGMRSGRFLVLMVTMHSERDAPFEYGPLDWRLYTDDGASLEPVVVGEDDRLGFGTLSRGQQTSGRLAFDVGEHPAQGRVEIRSIDGTVEGSWRIAEPAVSTTT
ncbi:DUF4352 domain-containing protein [Rhabdothermincola sp.]|uniref:DUF4352 domain-containing protein n=1 Tax=Rhabdothermincola sp. TaxID=2820405 RepID=UPI002FE30DC9